MFKPFYATTHRILLKFHQYENRNAPIINLVLNDEQIKQKNHNQL